MLGQQKYNSSTIVAFSQDRATERNIVNVPEVVERPLCELDVVGSFLGCTIPKALKRFQW